MSPTSVRQAVGHGDHALGTCWDAVVLSPEQAMGDKLDGRSDTSSPWGSAPSRCCPASSPPRHERHLDPLQARHVDPVEPANLEMTGWCPRVARGVRQGPGQAARRPLQTATDFVQASSTAWAHGSGDGRRSLLGQRRSRRPQTLARAGRARGRGGPGGRAGSRRRPGRRRAAQTTARPPIPSFPSPAAKSRRPDRRAERGSGDGVDEAGRGNPEGVSGQRCDPQDGPATSDRADLRAELRESRTHRHGAVAREPGRRCHAGGRGPHGRRAGAAQTAPQDVHGRDLAGRLITLAAIGLGVAALYRRRGFCAPRRQGERAAATTCPRSAPGADRRCRPRRRSAWSK